MGNNTPYKKVSISNGIDIVFWANEKEKAGQRYKELSATIAKSWKDQQGAWQNQSVALSMNDLFRLMAVSTQIKNVEDGFKLEQKAEKAAVQAQFNPATQGGSYPY